MIQLDYRDASPIYQQIIQSFSEQIITGVLREGDKLPSVRDLATQLAINPNTIQRAYLYLDSQGWITSVPGKGSFVSGVPACSRTALWEALDKAAGALLQAGVTREEIQAHLAEEVENNA